MAKEYNLIELYKSSFYSLFHPTEAFKKIEDNPKIKFVDAWIFVTSTIIFYHFLHFFILRVFSSNPSNWISNFVLTGTINLVPLLIGFWLSLFALATIWCAITYKLLKLIRINTTFPKLLVFVLYSCSLLLIVPVFDILHLIGPNLLSFPIDYTLPFLNLSLESTIFLHFSTIALVLLFLSRFFIFLRISNPKKTIQIIYSIILLLFFTIIVDKIGIEFLSGAFHLILRNSFGLFFSVIFDLILSVIFIMIAIRLFRKKNI